MFPKCQHKRAYSLYNKKIRTRSMEKRRGMAFGFWNMATAVKKAGQIDRYADR